MLHLDGSNSFVQLPPNIFDSLTQATVEGWVKWDRARASERFFDFGDRNAEIYVRAEGQQINALVSARDGTRHRVEVAGVLRTNEWCHIALVTGPGGAKLFFNGTLVGTNAYEGGFAALAGRKNYLGKSNFASTDTTTSGQMDEVRVWDQARTAEQIRENMFKTLTGTEAGLVGYWNFDEGTAKDRTARQRDGTLLGTPSFVQATLPDAATLRRVEVAWLSGKVTESSGNAVTNLDITVREGTRRIAGIRTDAAGEYHVSVAPATGPIAFTAVRGGRGGGVAGVRLNPGESRRLDFVLQPTRLAGRVLGTDGQPRQNVRVELLRVENNQRAVTNSVSNSRGEFRFNTPLPGPYLLRAVAGDRVVLLGEGKPVEMNWGTVLTNLEFKLADRTAQGARPEQGARPDGGTRPVRSGLVLDLSDQSGYVDLGERGPVLGARFTQELWMWPSRTEEWGALVGGHDESMVASSRSPSLYSAPRGRLHFGFGDGTTWNGFYTPDNALALGEWNHVATTYDGTTYFA